MVNDDLLLCSHCKRIVRGFAESIGDFSDDSHESALSGDSNSKPRKGGEESNGSSSDNNVHSDSDDSSLSSFDERVGIYGFEREVWVQLYCYLGLFWTEIYH